MEQVKKRDNPFNDYYDKMVLQSLDAYSARVLGAHSAERAKIVRALHTLINRKDVAATLLSICTVELSMAAAMQIIACDLKSEQREGFIHSYLEYTRNLIDQNEIDLRREIENA